MKDTKYITYEQAENIFHLCRRTIKKRMDEIGATVKIGKRVLFDTDIIRANYGNITGSTDLEDGLEYIVKFLTECIEEHFEVKDKVDKQFLAYFLGEDCKTVFDCKADFHFLFSCDFANMWEYITGLRECAYGVEQMMGEDKQNG